MQKNTRSILITGTALSCLGVIIGAFGAHYLKPVLIANQRLAAFETGVDYQMYHGLAILFLGLLHQKTGQKMLYTAFYLMLAGILFFSGSLYLLGITDLKVFGPITPLGGILFIAGWVVLILALLKKPSTNQ